MCFIKGETSGVHTEVTRSISWRGGGTVTDRKTWVRADSAVLVSVAGRSSSTRDGGGGSSSRWEVCVCVARGETGGMGGTTALPGSVAASGRRGERGGGREFPRLLGDGSVSGRGRGMHARWRGRAFTRGRRAPARHPRSVHHPDTHAAVGQRCTANQIKGGRV